jgi:undecaprenyl-diphosphatase
MIIQALVVGFVQGATEFLPVSSTAHLILVSQWFGWNSFPLNLEMAAHLGTLLAVLLYFGRDWIDILTGRRIKLFWSLVLATGVTGALALWFQPYFESIQNPLLIALTLAIFGLLLWGVDASSAATKDDHDVPSWRQSLMLGLVQALALVPGVSRSGILITSGRYLKYSREQAARYAFLLSAPIIALSPIGSLMKDGLVGLHFDSLAWGVFVFSGLFGWLAIAWLMKLLKKTDYRWFAIYRLVLAAIIIISLL